MEVVPAEHQTTSAVNNAFSQGKEGAPCMRKLLLPNLGENFSLLLLEVWSSNFEKHGRTTLKLAILNFERFIFFLSLKI